MPPDMTLDEIRQAVQARLRGAHDAKDEYDALEAMLAVVQPRVEQPSRARRQTRRSLNADPEAPYGRKADGTPRKRPGRRPASNGKPETAELRVTTAGVPPVKDGAEPAYVTQEG